MNKLITLALATAIVLFAQDDARRIAPASPGRRLALVIGNRNYTWKPLVNPANDARAVADTLASTGFSRSDIRLVLDAHRDDLRRAVREFIESVKPGDLVFVYYSGHGVEVKGNNYLLPVDLPADATEGYVQDEAVSAQRMLRDLTDQGARVRVLILDACRDNPLRAAKSAGGGLAPMEGRGSLIVFATEAGRTASDSPGAANSVFTRFLLEGLRTPGLSLDDAMKRVSRNVARATGERQVPAIYGLLLEDVVLIEGGRMTEPPPAATPVVVNRVPQAGEMKVNAKDGQRYVWIPPGKFTMGCSPGDNECGAEEKPAHEVEITKGFWMGQTTVTVGAWKKLGRGMPPEPKVLERELNPGWGNDQQPIVNVTWEEAKGFCEAVGMRLPTEAEWEYAARAGSHGARYGKLDDIAWYANNSGAQLIDSTAIFRVDPMSVFVRLNDNGNEPHPVGLKQPNKWKLHDMLGNVWQWTADWYGDEYYEQGEGRDPLGPPSGEYRTLRGGSWSNDPQSVRVSYRLADRFSRSSYAGARCMGE